MTNDASARLGAVPQYDVQKEAVAIEQANPEVRRGAGAGAENGVVVAAYTPGEDAAGADALEAAEGEPVEIVVRDAGGWAFCRAGGRGVTGWLPSAHVAELAALTADHAGGAGPRPEGLLAQRQGQVVEVVARHYSGWTYCREWQGPRAAADAAADRGEGWVADSYLEDRRSPAALASKWHRLVLQALEQVVAEASELELALAAAGHPTGAEDGGEEWLADCLEFVAWLAGELQGIAEAVQQQKAPRSGGEHEDEEWKELVSRDGGGDGSSRAPAAAGAAAAGAAGREAPPATGAAARETRALPAWVRLGAPCKWWSATGGRFCDAIVDRIDAQKQEVRVVFAADRSCWKVVGFGHFELPEAERTLCPLVDKERELREQLPEWVAVGSSASWWSVGQGRRPVDRAARR
ncbi:unnamed protein product [Prorocentrum cordatum]|uniref:SH3 domain-containing protein n=1 Tax=Prorocentrum cordatum TaxID=2364126 RepID=A0ABN9T843_9DINO|nr:unnamed protein product [Polarella glacialis]